MDPGQIRENSLYEYHKDDDTKLGVVEQIKNVRNTTIVRLDNGDQIPINEFCRTATVVNESSVVVGGPEGDEPQSHQPQNTGGNKPAVNVKLDENGIPVLPTQGEEGLSDVVHPNQYKVSNESKDKYAGHPIRALLEKTKDTKEEIEVKIPLKLIDKSLYNIIKSSFDDEDTKEVVYDFILKSIDDESLKKVISEKLDEYYGEGE